MADNKKSYYAVIPANVRYDDSLPPNAKLLYGEITALCNAGGFCWASNQYFANLYGVSILSIKRWIKALIDRGYITSRFIYKRGSKEIDTRCIQICYHPSIKNDTNPGIKNDTDNNTYINNTFNNTNEYIYMSDKPTKKTIKHKYGEYNNVLLTDEELKKLKDEFPDWEDRIERLSEYIEQKGNKYKSHYVTIRVWARKDKDKPQQKGTMDRSYEWYELAQEMEEAERGGAE